MLLDCVYWKNDKCIACEAFSMKTQCDKPECMHYVPFAKNETEIAYLLNQIYIRNKDIKDKSMLWDWKIFAGHDEFMDNDLNDLEWYVNEYLLMLKKSKYSHIPRYTSRHHFIAGLDLMRKYGYKITKAMTRKYNRLKRKKSILLLEEGDSEADG